MRYQLFISDTNMDLYTDESVVLTRKVKDLKKIGSVVSDFSQSFLVPATDRNNKVFSHWYDIDVIGGFNAHKKLDSEIHVDGLKVFEGVIEMKNVSFTGYEPKAYEIVFYGDTKKLSTALGEKLLEDIDWADYNHIRSAAKVISSWSGSLNSGKVLYPVVGLQKAFNYNSASGATLNDNIAQSATDVEVTDLRPAILLRDMVKTIIEDVGYTTQGAFYTDSYWDEMYVMPSAYAGVLQRTQVTPAVIARLFNLSTLTSSNTYYKQIFTSIVTDTTNSFSQSTGEFTIPTAGDYTFKHTFTVVGLGGGGTITATLFDNGSATSSSGTTSVTGTKVITFSLTGLAQGDKVDIRLKGTGSGFTINSQTFEVTGGPTSNSDMSVNLGELMPKMKASEFVNKVCETFNLVLIPNGDLRIDIEPYQNWLESGTTRDYTKYVDISNVRHEKIDVPSTLRLSHAKTSDFVNAAFFNNNQRDFGAVETQPAIDFANGGAMNVSSPFSVFPQAFLKKLNSNGSFTANTNIQIYHALDADLNPLNTPFLLFYYCGLKSSNTWYFNTSAKTTFPIISPFSEEPSASTSNSVAFSLESCLNGNAPTNTILSKWWLDFISRTYSTTSRKVIMSITLPVGEWLKLKLNDTINISGRYYKVDSVKYNLLDQRAQLTLMTYPKVDVLDISSSSGNNFNINAIAPSDLGNTFIGFGGQQTTLSNTIKVNDVTSTDAPNQQDVQLILRNAVVTDVIVRQDLGDGGTETP